MTVIWREAACITVEKATRRVAGTERSHVGIQQLAQLATALSGEEPDRSPQRGRRRTLHQPADQ